MIFRGVWFKSLVIFLLVLTTVSRGQEETETKTLGNGKEKEEKPILYKCSDDVSEEILTLNDQLKLPYAPQKLEYFTEIFHTKILFNFTLITRQPQCKDGNFEMEIPTHLGPLEPRLFNFTPDGYLGTFKGKEEIYYHPENFCVSRITLNSIFVKACKSQCGISDNVTSTIGNICIEKCCTLGQALTPRGCKDAMKKDWSPSIYPRLKSTDVAIPQIYPQLQYNQFNHHWHCGDGEILDQTLHNPENIRIVSSGKIFARKPGKTHWFKMNDGQNSRSFCIDGVWTNGDVYEPENSKYLVRSCKLNVTKEVIVDHFYLQVYPQIVFGVTLVATLIHLMTVSVHICLWERQQNVHGWTIFLFCLSQFLLTLFLCGLFGVFAFGDPESALNGSLHDLCITIGIVHHFLLIFSFSCSTVLTFDVFYKLRSTKATGGSKGRKKFMAYCSVGFGIPTIFVVVGILMEFAIGDPDEDNLIRPGYNKTCIIQNSWKYFLYIGFAIAVLFVSNMILALLTLKSLWDAMRSMKTFKDSATSAAFEHKAQLVGKLMVMMGVFLVIEVILAFTSPLQVSHVFVFLDFYRIFHAVGLFWIFVLNKRTLAQLGAKYPILNRFRSQATSPQTTSTVVIDSTKDTGDRKLSLTAENKL